MIAIPQRFVGESLLNSARRFANKTAVICDNEKYSYDMLKTYSLKLAYFLRDSGIRKGDRIGIYLNNSVESVLALYGITMAGGVFVFINPQTKAEKLKYIIGDCEIKILITEYLLIDNIIETFKDTKSVNTFIFVESCCDKVRPELVNIIGLNDVFSQAYKNTLLPAVIPTDLAAIIYTSGSTGFPKGVMMTHQSMVFVLWSIIEYLRLDENERIMVPLPFSFDYGLYQILMSIAIGGTLIIENSFYFPYTFYKNIRIMGPTVIPGVPTLYAMMIASHKKSALSFTSVKKITNTAAVLPSTFIPFLKEIFPNALIFKMYGLTECKRVCYLEPEQIDIRPDSVGKAIPGTEVFILNNSGEKTPPGKIGILYVRGPHIMAGYWNKKKLTDEMLKPGKIPGEKFLCTHDLFREDKEGFLYFVGRTDDIIKSRGEKVSPVEVENIIHKVKGINEVAVLGIPDEILGESIIACVTINKSVNLTEDDILKICRENLELFMIPQKIYILDELPKTENGKIDKKHLKECVISLKKKKNLPEQSKKKPG